jgi:glycopeptide antibiotics resistance protein
MEEIVWGVMYAMGLLLTGTGWVIYYIMRTSYIEMSDDKINSSDISANIPSTT